MTPVINIIDSYIVNILVVVTLANMTTVTATIACAIALAVRKPALLPVRIRSEAADRHGEAGGSGCD